MWSFGVRVGVHIHRGRGGGPISRTGVARGIDDENLDLKEISRFLPEVVPRPIHRPRASGAGDPNERLPKLSKTLQSVSVSVGRSMTREAGRLTEGEDKLRVGVSERVLV